MARTTAKKVAKKKSVKSLESTPVPKESKIKVTRFNFLLERRLLEEGTENIYTILLPKETKIVQIYEFQQDTLGGQHITDFQQVWDVPYLLCERPNKKVDEDNLEERSFVLINALNIEEINNFSDTVFVGTMDRKNFTTTNKFFLYEIKER